MNDSTNEVIKDNIDCGYSINIKRLKIRDKSDDGK